MALVYGQMNEPPGARARVALTGLTVAEYFRDQEGQDVLLFIDNIFRWALRCLSWWALIRDGDFCLAEMMILCRQRAIDIVMKIVLIIRCSDLPQLYKANIVGANVLFLPHSPLPSLSGV